MDSAPHAWTDPNDAAWLLDLTEGSTCTVAPNIMPRHLAPEEFRRRAGGLYRVGVPHLFFWDCAGPAGRANYRDMWSAIRRLGHREEIAAWQAAGEAELAAPTRALHLLGDWDLSYQTPG